MHTHTHARTITHSLTHSLTHSRFHSHALACMHAVPTRQGYDTISSWSLHLKANKLALFLFSAPFHAHTSYFNPTLSINAHMLSRSHSLSLWLLLSLSLSLALFPLFLSPSLSTDRLHEIANNLPGNGQVLKRCNSPLDGLGLAMEEL